MMHNELWIKKQYEAIPCEERSRYALISMKIKHLRRMNRKYGRAYGDELIRAVYQIAIDNLKANEGIAHLYYGHFNLIMELPKDTHDFAILKWITAFGNKIFKMEDDKFNQNVFCGFGIYPLTEEPIDFFIAQYNADICRCESAENKYSISHVEIYGSSYIEKGLFAPDYRKMLEPALKNGHFHMYLQPKVDLKTGAITHAEALMRWIDPELGMIPIRDFFDTLEECGQTNLIDMFIFKEACKTILKWKQKYDCDIHISVNLSKTTFAYPFFLDEFVEVHNAYPCQRDLIEVELLESIILNQAKRIKEVGEAIHNRGFQSAIDDFGSGYSSYSVLTQTPLNTLKIDRSLFCDYHNPRERIMIRHIIESAHEMGLQVVAEGVEEPGYVTFLKGLSCDFIQGFVFYKPMPIEEFEERFVKGNEHVLLSRYI